MPTISQPQTKRYISVLSSTFLMLSEQELLSASHFSLQRALNLGMEKTFTSYQGLLLNRALCAVGTEQIMLIYTIPSFIRQHRS